MTTSEVEEKSYAAAELFILTDLFKNAENIMLYMPLKNETDTSYIIQKAYQYGKKVILPVTDKESGNISPCYADINTTFIKGAFSVDEPTGDNVAEISEIDVILVPGIAFDTYGNRIGFGKGCYDRLLNKTDAIKVGFCYDWQFIKSIPADKHDVRMDYIITEKEIIRI